MSTSDHEILIVGGGPAGLSTWLHLHALEPLLAARAIVVEKALYPRDKPCGGGVTPLGENLLRGLDLTLDVPSVEIQAVDFRFLDRTHRLQRPHALRVVRRREFDHALATAAVARGLELHEGETFGGFERIDGRLRVRTTRGEYDVSVLVGADGVYSRVRQAMHIGDDDGLARVIEVVTPVDVVRDPEFASRTVTFDFGPVAAGLQGYVWHFPCLCDGAPAMNRGIYDSRVHPARARADLRRLFREALTSRRVVGDPTWTGHPLRWLRDNAVFARPNVLLVGDAAGVDAALGEGIAPSLDYGDLAANVIVAAFERGDFRLSDYRDRLQAHPVGQSLRGRYHLARHLYEDTRLAMERLPAMLTAWLAQA